MTDDPITERLVQLESLVTHLQYDLEQMNDVLLTQQTEMASLKREIERLQGHIDRFDGDEFRNPQDERPPHY